jgi:hypothetical protein
MQNKACAILHPYFDADAHEAYVCARKAYFAQTGERAAVRIEANACALSYFMRFLEHEMQVALTLRAGHLRFPMTDTPLDMQDVHLVGERIGVDRKMHSRWSMTDRLKYSVGSRLLRVMHSLPEPRTNKRWLRIKIVLEFDHDTSCIVWNGELWYADIPPFLLPPP